MMKRKKKRKPTKYKPVVFMLTSRQKKSLEVHCKEKKTTLIKLIKRSINDYLNLQIHSHTEYHVSPNQLDLFENRTVGDLKKLKKKQKKIEPGKPLIIS
jgi:hypothetical protein